MNNWTNEINRIFNGRYNRLPEVFFGEVPPDIFSWLKNAAKRSKEKNLDARRALAGHINEEYDIFRSFDKSKSIVESSDTNYIKYENFIKNCAFDPYFEGFWRKTNILTRPCELSIVSTWVNFQKKYEFNPPHTHTGLFSWIIFLNIPYNLEDENKVFPEMNIRDENNEVVFVTSRLAFLLVNPYLSGGIDHVSINVDKSFEGKIMMFPSYLQHEVFPFYTSDDYRITISGNASLDVNKPTN